jgi:hypothetical protein
LRHRHNPPSRRRRRKPNRARGAFAVCMDIGAAARKPGAARRRLSERKVVA